MLRISLLLLSIALSAMVRAASPAVPQHIVPGADLKEMVWAVSDPSFVPDAFLPLFSSAPLPDAVFSRMKGKSYPEGCPVQRSDLRYLILPHYDGNGHVRIGEMVANKAIASGLVEIFRELFRNAYPIERMVLIDEYDGDDERSMADNNTSCFNYRRVAGSKKLSRHARGMAVDLNPRYNPYVRTVRGRTLVRPANGAPFAGGTRKPGPFIITASDPAYHLFRSHGFSWGGSWRTAKDYQHFHK